MAAQECDIHIAHLLQELKPIHELIMQSARQMRCFQSPPNDLQGLYISDEEIDAILSGTHTPPFLSSRIPHHLTDDDSINRQSRLNILAARFGLDGLARHILLLALAPEIDLTYEQLYAYLQDDATRRRPTIDLILNLLCHSIEAKLAALGAFAPGAPLLRFGLVRLTADPADHQPPLLRLHVCPEARLIGHLLGRDDIDQRLLPYAHLQEELPTLENLILNAGTRQQLVALTSNCRTANAGSIVAFQGPTGTGRRIAAAALCRELGLSLLIIDGARILARERETFEVLLCLAIREAGLHGAALYWDGFDALLDDDREQECRALIMGLAAQPGPSFVGGHSLWEPHGDMANLSFFRIELSPPNTAERLQLWQRALKGVDAEVGSDVLHELAGTFRLSHGQIHDAAATVRRIAAQHPDERRALTAADLAVASRMHSNRRLSELARQIIPRRSWDDLVLPADRLQQLAEICNAVRYRTLVYDTWGFDEKLSLGKGISALFAGPSGTGKTLAAEIIAGDLGLELYAIDLATVVSKYIGETEKNLARIFAEAETSNAVLFFDEADALFGKRSEVKDSHDRYANLEIAYLLQRMEAYQGVVILATNLRKNIDDAFVRRLQFIVEFPFPSENDRRRIWEVIWPATLPRDPTIDLDGIARRFEVAGGNIRNIALAAAFLAAADGRVVRLPHLMHATRREYRKMGKVAADGELAQ